jgi:membrane fusion protein, multidrug efflux system
MKPLFCFCSGALALLSLAGCHRKAPPPPPAEVGVVTVSTQAITLTTELPGRVVAHRMADVRPQVGGVILRRLFTEGGNVEAGQALYQIDPAPYQAALDNARAAVEKASATLTSSTALLNRYRPLVEANAVSKQDFDNAQAAQRGAAAELTSAEAALSLAHINVVYTRVLSPISGRIGRSSVTEGALVTANQDAALATVQQLNPIYVDVTQPSTLLMRLRRQYDAGRLRRAGKNQAVVHLRLEDDTAYDLAGKLQFTEVTVDPGTGAVTLRAVFPNPKETLLPGMFVHELIQEGVDDQALLVPQRGVSHDQRGEPIAFILGKDGKVELRSLKTDRSIGDQWLVTSGLQAGDRVIVEGLQKIMPGAPAHGVEASTATAPTQSAPGVPAH